MAKLIRAVLYSSSPAMGLLGAGYAWLLDKEFLMVALCLCKAAVPALPIVGLWLWTLLLRMELGRSNSPRAQRRWIKADH